MSYAESRRSIELRLPLRDLGLVTSNLQASGICDAPRLKPPQPDFVSIVESLACTIDVEPRRTTSDSSVDSFLNTLLMPHVPLATQIDSPVAQMPVASPIASLAPPQEKPSLQLSTREAAPAPQYSVGRPKTSATKGELKWVARKVPWMPVG